MDRVTRKLLDSKEDKIVFVKSVPTSGLSDGDKVFARRGNKPLALYIKQLGHLWWSYFTKDGDYLVDRDLDVERNAKIGGDSTVAGDFTLSGHKDSQTFMANAFQYPNPGTDWTPTLNGAYLGTGLAAKKCWIPLNFLKIGDEIVSYKLVGDAVENTALTLNCKLVRINKADPITTTNIAGGAITQVDSDGAFDSEATLTAVETIATDKQYALEILGTCGVGNEITVMGAELKVNRK